MKCVICKDEILADVGGWDKGHNPDPVKTKGRCCSLCNDTVVLPVRLQLHFNEDIDVTGLLKDMRLNIKKEFE